MKDNNPSFFIYFFLVSNVIPIIIISMVKILVKSALETIEKNSWKLKYAKPKTIKWWIIVKIEINTIALLNATVRKLNSKYSKSDFPSTIFKTGSRMKAINREAAALIPPESEKKSTERPRKKLKINNKLIFFRNGNKNIQDM